jgi:hypothetical protein
LGPEERQWRDKARAFAQNHVAPIVRLLARLVLCSTSSAAFGWCADGVRVCVCGRCAVRQIDKYYEKAEFPFELLPKLKELGIMGGTIQGYGCPVRLF